MAEKGFGVKEINLIGASGTPTIESPNNLNLNAVNVAISTNVSIGGTLTVSGNLSIGGTITYEDVTNIDSIGIVTARTGVKVLSGGINVVGTSYFNNNIVATATTAVSVTAADESSDTSCNVLFATAASGNVAPKTGTNLTFNSSNGTLSATTFSGSGASLTSIPAANITGTLPADLQLPAANLTGTVADARISTLTASKLTGPLPAISGANLTNLPADTPTNTDIQVVYTVTANGSSAYRFGGNGIVSTEDNPDVYLIRGLKYRFINNSGGSHPFQIRQSSGGSAYSAGVTNNGASSGNIDFQVPYSAPSHLYYQCTSHGGMVGNLYIRGAGGQNTNVGVTTFSGVVSGVQVNLQSTGGDLINVTSTNAASRSTIKFNTNGNDWEIGARGSTADNPNNFYFFDSATTSYRMLINSDGQLLVGNTASGFTTKLVAGTGSGDNGITVYGGTSNNTFLHFADGNSGADRYRGYVNYSHSDNSMQFGTNDTEQVRITDSGRVGIMETSPQSPLQVKGGIRSAQTPANGHIDIKHDGTNGSLVSTYGSFLLYGQTGDFILHTTGSNTERLRIRGSDGNVMIKTDVQFDTDGSGGIFGKIVRSSAAYTANTNIDINITGGNYIFSIRSAGVYHYNGIFLVTYYDSADRSSVEVVHGDYQTTASDSIIHNGSNNGTFRLSFSRDFTSLIIRQLKIG